MPFITTSNTVSPEIDRMIKSLSSSSTRKILSNVAQEFINQTKSNFGTSGNYREKQWPAYSISYAKKVNTTTPTLYRSGKLYNSIKINSNGGNWIGVSSNTAYSAAQTFGSPKTNLPARNFWPVQFQSPNYSRLLLNSEKQINNVIARQLVIQSDGAFPYPIFTRQTFTYGNPFRSATN